MLRTFALLSLLFHGLFSAYAWNPTYVERLKALQKNGLPYFYNDAVENEINVLLNNEDSRTAFLIGKSQYFFGAIEKELDAQNLPRFLKYIPFANTSMSMNQVAPDGATGPLHRPWDEHQALS